MDSVSRKRRILITLFVTAVLIVVLINSATWLSKIVFPIYHKDLIFRYSREYDVDPYLIAAIIKSESKFYHKATSARMPGAYADITNNGRVGSGDAGDRELQPGKTVRAGN